MIFKYFSVLSLEPGKETELIKQTTIFSLTGLNIEEKPFILWGNYSFTMAKKDLLKSDYTQRHLVHIYEASAKAWHNAGMDKIFGNLQIGSSRRDFPVHVSGPEFLIIFPQNAQKVVRKLKKGQHASIGGFCFLHYGMITASKRVTDRNGNKFTVHLDLSAPLPKDVFPSGKPLQSSQYKRLNGAKLGNTGWKLHVPGINQGVPLEVIVKTLRYFEIARSTGTNLVLMIPTHEYIAATIPNMQLLNMPPEAEAMARNALIKIGRNYADTFHRMNAEFFPDVNLRIILTHNPKFRAEINSFARKHPKLMKMETTVGDGFIVDATPAQRKAIRELWAKESLAYKKLFSYIFASSEPMIFMLHARDIDGYPLEGIQVAEKTVGRKNLERNILFLGIPGAPVVAIKDAWPHLQTGKFGKDSKKLGGRDHALPKDIDARADAYFGRRGEKAYTKKFPTHFGEGMRQGGGRCPAYTYVRTIGPYVGVTEKTGHKVLRALGKCNANTSHRECHTLFRETHQRLKRAIHPPQQKRRTQQHARR